MSPALRAPIPVASDPAPAPTEPVTRGRVRDVAVEAMRTLAANPLTLAGFVLVVLLVAVAVLVVALPPISHALVGHSVSILPYDPTAFGSQVAAPPSGQHWFGTDELGRDVFSRVVAALPLDLAMGVVVTVVSIVIGAALGLIAGFWDESLLGRVTSATILRVTDVFLAFPTLVLVIALSAIFGHQVDPLTAIILALIISWWPYYVRIVRGEVLVIKHQGYIHAARLAGLSDARILWRHVLRNLLEPLTVYATLDIGTVIVTFSTVAFVIGSLPITVIEWGSMVATYESFLPGDWWLVFAPGLAIFVTVLALSLVGDGLRDVLDPRTRRVFAREGQTSTAPAPSSPLADSGE
jgi:peptide/nickel transport system permease protein